MLPHSSKVTLITLFYLIKCLLTTPHYYSPKINYILYFIIIDVGIT